VVVSRALVNLIYGHRRKLESLSIGQVWMSAGNAASVQQKAKKTLVK
jgi:preprotein translocase subunit SecD